MLNLGPDQSSKSPRVRHAPDEQELWACAQATSRGERSLAWDSPFVPRDVAVELAYFRGTGHNGENDPWWQTKDSLALWTLDSRSIDPTLLFMGPLMSTTTTPRRTGRTTIPGETRICIPGVNWRFYEWLVDSIPEGTGVRVAFDGTDVEIMTTSPEHEDFKELLGRFVGLVAEELGIPHKSMGETTWKRVRVNRGIEADQCFYFRPDKLAAAAAAKAKRTNDVAHYPDPDLAIEVDLSPSALDRPGIYAALKVAEVWRFNGQNLRIDRLSSRGRYAAVAASKLLPVRADQVCRWILEEDTSDLTSWSRSVRRWVRADLSRVD